MPNGADKNLRRLLMACTVYQQKYGEWPSQARMSPVILHDLARLLDQENFERLAAHLQMRTKDRMGSLSAAAAWWTTATSTMSASTRRQWRSRSGGWASRFAVTSIRTELSGAAKEGTNERNVPEYSA